MRIYKKVILIILFCILLVFCLYFVNKVYAKYKTSVSGNAAIAISRWNIKINNNSIKSNQDISSSIKPIFPGSDNIASNIIAPTAEGYFDLALDFKDVDVTFKYEINISADENSVVKDLVATGYSINNGEKVTFTDFNLPITDIINFSDENRTRTIRVFVMWNDNPDTSSMDNAADTASTTKADSFAILKVSIAFTQVAQ